MQGKAKYSSFGVGGLLFSAFDRLFTLLKEPDWEAKLKLEAIENQFLRIKTEAARKRIVTEIIKRCRNAWPGFWTYYEEQNEMGRKAALLALCIKVYPLVADLHLHFTTRAHWLQEDILSCELVMSEIEKLAASNPELDKWATSTRNKSAQTYLHTLREAGLLDNHKTIKLPLPDTWFCFYMKAGDYWVMDAFFTTEPEKQQIRNYCL